MVEPVVATKKKSASLLLPLSLSARRTWLKNRLWIRHAIGIMLLWGSLLFNRHGCRKAQSSSSSSSSSLHRYQLAKVVKKDGPSKASIKNNNGTVALPAFVKKYCILENGTQWWPQRHLSRKTTRTSPWVQRAPAFLIMGAKKGGTTALYSFLKQHPFIAPPIQKELLYFNPHRFPHWKKSLALNNNKTIKMKNANVEDLYHQVKVRAARSSLSEYFPSKQLQKYPHKLSYEATPDYVTYSTYSSRAILCTIPWVKLIVLLRHPTERVWSHYNFLQDPQYVNRTLPPFDEWLEQEFASLANAGVISSHPPGSKQEAEAWRNYQHRRHLPGDRILARSLYILQLEPWFQALREIGRNPQTAIHFVHSRDLDRQPQVVVDKITSWLGIPSHHLKQKPRKMATKYTHLPMSNETYNKLQQFFRPYNERLYKILGKDWEGIWD